jgi:hypothetical protein
MMHGSIEQVWYGGIERSLRGACGRGHDIAAAVAAPLLLLSPPLLLKHVDALLLPSSSQQHDQLCVIMVICRDILNLQYLIV